MHHGPVTHLVTAEDIARDVTQIDHDHTARGQQQKIHVQRVTLAVGHQHVTHMIEATARYGQRAHGPQAPALIPAPRIQQHGDQAGDTEQEGGKLEIYDWQRFHGSGPIARA